MHTIIKVNEQGSLHSLIQCPLQKGVHKKSSIIVASDFTVSIYCFSFALEVGRMPLPTHKEMYTLIPRTCNYVTLHGKRHLADVIKITDFEMR